MDNPKVSVIIPVYNGSKTLKQCLESVLSQTYNNCEVIVVNNNSTDDTEAIIKEFCAGSESIKYVCERYRSRGAARNAGIKIATGEIIAMTDSDCVVPKNWLSELIKLIVSEHEMAVMGFEEDLVGNYWTKNIQKANEAFIERNVRGEYIAHLDTKNFSIKASLMKELEFDPGLNSLIDYDLYLRLRKRTKIRYISSIRVGHYHKSSLGRVVEVNFRRAYWARKIYEKYGSNGIKGEPMTESISIRNIFLFPFWLVFQFIKKPVDEAFFILVSECSWRAGIIRAMIR